MRRISLRLCFLLSILICCFKPAAAQSSLYSFDKLGLEEGLSQSSVTAIFQDSKGFLWFGTANGLNKFDGYSFRIYKYDPSDSNSLSNDMITSIAEDKRGMLWIGTEEGLNLFDPVKEKIVRIDNPLNSRSNKIFSLIVDHDVIWIGTDGGGLNKYDPAKKSFTRFVNDPDSTHDSSLDFIRNIQQDEKGNLWLATMGGLSKFDQQKNEFTNFYKNFVQQNSDIRKEVYSLMIDEDGIIWFGTDGSLNRFDQKKNNLESFISGDRTVNSYFRIWTLLNDSKGKIWIGTGGNGIHIFDKKDNSFRIVRNNPYKPKSLSENSVNNIFEDRSGVIWIGTSTSGINKYIGNKYKFKHFKFDPENINTISNNIIYGIAEDKTGSIWIGTVDGLNRVDKNGKVARYRRKPDCSSCISSNIITDVAEDKNGNIWIATRWGLNRYLSKTNSFKLFRAESDKKNWLSSSNLSDLFIDDDGIMWIGSFNYGLYRFDPAKEIFTHYLSGRENSISSNHIRTITSDNKGRLLIGTDRGVDIFEKNSGEVIASYQSKKNDQSLSSNYVLSIFCDREGIIWVGTYGGGLNKIDPEKKEITFFSEDKGMPNNVVYGILPDDSGNLWLSTNKGLVRFNKHTNAVRVYEPSDGLQSYEFNSNAYFRSRSGEMFFGGVNGYNSFYPDKVEDNQTPPPVVITSVKNLHQEISREIIQSDMPAELSYNQNFLTFDFVSLDYTNTNKNKYAYKLEGFDTDWIQTAGRRFAAYTNLPPGQYTFHVRGSNSDEVWNEKGASFKFVIYPPFWKTWWFYVLSAAALVSLIIFIHRYRLRMKLQRIYEIETVRKKIADDFHDELGHKLTKISLYSELMRNDLNGNIKEAEHYLKKINDAANSLFDDTKDFIWSLDPVKDSLYDLAVYLKDFGDELFDKTEIAFRVSEIPVELSQINLLMEWKRQLILIFKEAMNNCLRHSSSKNVRLAVSAHDDVVEIILTDDGLGFMMGNGTRGRGLSNMKERALRIGGELIIDSVPGGGTTLRFVGRIQKQTSEVPDWLPKVKN